MQASDGLKAACAAALGQFRLNYRDWPRDEDERKLAAAQYLRWFIGRCQTRGQVAAVTGRVLETLKRRPLIAELNEIYAELYPPQPVSTETPLTPGERKQRAEFMRDWYARLEAGAPERRARFLADQKKRTARAAPRAPLPVAELKPITPEDVERAIAGRAAAKAEGAGE